MNLVRCSVTYLRLSSQLVLWIISQYKLYCRWNEQKNYHAVHDHSIQTFDFIEMKQRQLYMYISVNEQLLYNLYNINIDIPDLVACISCLLVVATVILCLSMCSDYNIIMLEIQR